MALFLSSYLNKVDKKSRLSIPVRFRTVLQQQGGAERLIVFRSFSHKSLEACSMNFVDELWKKLQNLNPFTAEQEDLLWSVLGGCCELAIDNDGRVVIPAALLEYAGIENTALLVGQGDRFQIWNPELAAAFEKQVQARIDAKFSSGKNVWATSSSKASSSD